MEKLLAQVQRLQDDVLTWARIIPDGTYGKAAVNLAWESLRLGWYMMRDDRVGEAEKAEWVKLAYDHLVDERKRRK